MHVFSSTFLKLLYFTLLYVSIFLPTHNIRINFKLYRFTLCKVYKSKNTYGTKFSRVFFPNWTLAVILESFLLRSRFTPWTVREGRIQDTKYDTRLSKSYILTCREQRTRVPYTRILPSMSSYRRYLICVSMERGGFEFIVRGSIEQRCRYEPPLKGIVC